MIRAVIWQLLTMANKIVYFLFIPLLLLRYKYGHAYTFMLGSITANNRLTTLNSYM